MTAVEEVFVVTSSGSGHLFPCIELCKHISSRNYKTTLILSSAVPSSFHPLLSTFEIHHSSAGDHPTQPQTGLDLETHLATRSNDKDSIRPLCAIIDFQMGWTKHIFWKFNVPVISFFTFGACAAAMEWGAWKCEASNMVSGEVRTIPGLPEEMVVTYSDCKRRPKRPSGTGGGGGGPPKPGDKPPWVPLVEGSVGLLFNTCDDLERPFINYLTNELGMPVCGVGPLLPEQYWQSHDLLIHDRLIRQSKNHSNCSEDEVIQWLDSKPRGSAIYVAFGSQLGPTMEEYPQLAGALEDSIRPFIWVIQSGSGLPNPNESDQGYVPHGLQAKVGDRGLIIRGWAPQLLILSHPSTGGFLSHCGWNSTVEAIGQGVPFLAWPIRGDQIYNAKLVVNYLKVGYMTLHGDTLEMVKREDIGQGIEKLMCDEEVHKGAAELRIKLGRSFPPSSEASLDVFRDFIIQKTI
ncbi:unnamed protein product [Ilex paraguariensis]|uniref:Glycosyltransferase n=1 Tax=Ilex paraguariensis TaxID=185542 RepID=A0ABC8SAW9_9AQUA